MRNSEDLLWAVFLENCFPLTLGSEGVRQRNEGRKPNLLPCLQAPDLTYRSLPNISNQISSQHLTKAHTFLLQDLTASTSVSSRYLEKEIVKKVVEEMLALSLTAAEKALQR